MNTASVFTILAIAVSLLVPVHGSGIPSNTSQDPSLYEGIEYFNSLRVSPLAFEDYNLTIKAKNDLIIRANEGDRLAQDEVVTRVLMTDINLVDVECENWDNIQELAKNSVAYCRVFLLRMSEKTVEIYPSVITDLVEKADQGNALAKVTLAFAYCEGFCVDKDKKKAFCLVQEAANQGLALAMLEMAKYFQIGIGVNKDLDQSLAWLHKAAENGSSAAQIRLAFGYKYGWLPASGADLYNIVENPAKALAFLIKAAQNGNEKSFLLIYTLLKAKTDTLCSTESFNEKVECFNSLIDELSAYCEMKMALNNKIKGFMEAQFSIPRLESLYRPIFKFCVSLSSLLLSLLNADPGFYIDCVELSDQLSGYLSVFRDSEYVRVYDKGIICIGAKNIKLLSMYKDYIVYNAAKEITIARRAIDKLINSLYLSHASLHAFQQTAIPNDQNSIDRYHQEYAEYQEVLNINSIEIKLLQKFKERLDEIERRFANFLDETIGTRNREFLEEFSFLKG